MYQNLFYAKKHHVLIYVFRNRMYYISDTNKFVDMLHRFFNIIRSGLYIVEFSGENNSGQPF